LITKAFRNKHKNKSPEKLLELIQETEKKIKLVQNEDPFWFFQPNDGEITPERRKILSRYLKDEDIPVKVDSQSDVLLCDSEIIGDSGGNRSSKTVTGTIKGIIKQTGELPDSMQKYKDLPLFEFYKKRAENGFVRGRVTAVDSNQLERVVLDAWKHWIPRKYLKNRSWEDSYSKQFDILTLYKNRKPCGTVEFLKNSQETRSSQGGELDWANFDEEPDEDKYKETLMRFGTAERLDIQIDWTPTMGLTWATDLFHHDIYSEDIENPRADNVSLFKLSTVCNRYVDQNTIVKIMDEYQKISTYEEMKMRLLGEAISLSGLVYGNLFHPSIHVIKPFYEHIAPYKQREYLCLAGYDPHLVHATAGVFVLVDRENNVYVDRCYTKEADTEDVKRDFHKTVKQFNYRMGWTVADKSSDSTIIAFGGRNIFKELARGAGCIPAMRTSEKYDGSIKAGVNEIKKKLKQPATFFVVDRPENKPLIKSFRTMERDTYINEALRGPKDRINEGKHHHHAALRYIFQFPVNWYPEQIAVPEPQFQDAAALY
jgi:hypothetical protein